MRRSPSLFSPSAIKALVNGFVTRLEDIELQGGDFKKLVADVEQCCFEHKNKIKGDFQVDGLISRLLHRASELGDSVSIRKILRLKYIAASDENRPDEIQRYLKKFEDAFCSKNPELVEKIFEEVKLELANEATLEEVRNGFLNILVKFVSRVNHQHPSIALEIADFMRDSPRVPKHHKDTANRMHAKLKEAAPWYSLPSCCSSRVA